MFKEFFSSTLSIAKKKIKNTYFIIMNFIIKKKTALRRVPLSFIHKLFVLKNLNVFTDLKSST